MRMKILGVLVAVLMGVTGGLVATVSYVTPAEADGCYTWSRTLKKGMKGSDVKRLQVRLAGWVSKGENLALDGIFGERTRLAVKRFKNGYGLSSNTGVAGSGVFNKLYKLQDGDCTPAHFAYGEFNDSCGENNFTGGKVSSSTAKRNIRRLMWQLEAERRKLGSRPMVISSGFRSISCNSAVGGSSGSLHMYGRAADLSTASGPSLCSMWRAARYAGFEEILGPGYPGHGDHTHVGNKSSRFWSASRC